MGATGWSYFVLYQKDITRALQKLREEVFKEGRYQKPNKSTDKEVEKAKSLIALHSSNPDSDLKKLDQIVAMAAMLKTPQKSNRAPKTIKELLKQCEEAGTHSILDIERVSSTPSIGAVTPLPRQQLLNIFGTEQPTRVMVEKWSTRNEPLDVEPLYGRWEGIYIIVYKDTRPDEIYFEGCSGD